MNGTLLNSFYLFKMKIFFNESSGSFVNLITNL